MANEGIKYDGDKTRYDLFPADSLEAVGRVFTHGAAKYTDRNWERGMKWGRVFGACMRHLWAFWRGENLDPDSGEPHLSHAGCCILMLLAYYLRSTGIDTRWTEPEGDHEGCREKIYRSSEPE